MKKPRGHFDVIFAVDCETSGINYTSNDISNNYQSISWGIIVSDPDTFEEIDSIYVEIKFDDTKYLWDWKAEKIHGLSREHLEENGETSEDASAIITDFILKYHNIDKPLILLGHNVGTFDRIFLKKLLHSHGMNFKFAGRCLDTFSLSMGTVKEFNSDDLFNRFGLKERAHHNSLEDARNSLMIFKYCSELWEEFVQSS